MKTNTYTIDTNTDAGFLPVEGIPVRFPDFPDLQLFAHHPWCKLRNGKCEWDNTMWAVSEVTTGAIIGFGHSTMPCATVIKCTHERLTYQGLDSIRAAIAKILAQRGPIPTIGV